MTRKITSKDLLSFRFIENLSFNPSGTAYAFQLAEIDKKKDSYFRSIAIGRKTYRFDKSTSHLGWYDDDQLIITKNDPKAVLQRYSLLNRKDGSVKTLLSTSLKIENISVIDPKTLVFTAYIDMNEPNVYLYDREKLKKYREKKKKEADYEVLDEIPYWFNGAGFINKLRKALFVCSLRPLKITRITAPDFAVSDYMVSGNRIIYFGSSYRQCQPLYQQIYAYDVTDRKNECLYAKADHMISDLKVINDKLLVSATRGERYGLNETSTLHLLENGKLIPLPTPDLSLYDAAAIDTTLGGGKGRVVKDDVLDTLASVKDHIEIFRFDRNMKHRSLVKMPLISFFDVGKDRIIFCGSDQTSLPELYEYSFKDRKVRKISSYNDKALKDCYIARPQEIEYMSEGYRLNGWVLLPEGYDRRKKYPAVLDIHGGPRAIYTQAFFHEMQIWASAGYFVMFTNIRGSDGRGDEFADLRGRYGSIDYRNLMDFTDAVLKKYPAIDKDRLCETGGSYGGFMTNWIISHTDRFCCAASQRSISNWTGFTYLSDIGYVFAADQNGCKDPIAGYEKLWDHSPLKYVDNVKTPTLFIHSDQDWRCPFPEGMQMMQTLAERGVETRLVLFHGENHELSRSGKPSHRIRRLNEILDWFNDHTK